MDRTPEEWCRLTGIQIMDPDGWRGRMADKKITDSISREDFINRAQQSTCRRWPTPLHDELTSDSLTPAEGANASPLSENP